MDIEIKLDKKYENPKIIIYANELTDQISELIDGISSINPKILKAYKNEKMYILKQAEIETIFSEGGKIYARCNNELYYIKNRLYELENILDKKMFLRISNSEIVNFNLIDNIDFKIMSSLILNFKSGNKSYASRRYIPKIKDFLEI